MGNFQTTTKLLHQSVVVGCRIPKNYFVTKGKGESDIAIHAGSYHLALKDAGIEMCNIMTYSSILPNEATEVTKPTNIKHGQVLESIMSVAHAEKGQRATAGIITGWLFNRKTGKKYGGLVCENSGNYTEEELKEKLLASMKELYTNGFDQDYELKCIDIITETFVPKKKHGTALVSICFTNYIIPVLSEN